MRQKRKVSSTSFLDSCFSFTADGQPIDAPAPVATAEDVDRQRSTGAQTPWRCPSVNSLATRLPINLTIRKPGNLWRAILPIVTLASSKGGCGKTTIARLLLGHAVRNGLSAAALDADLNHSLTDWINQHHPVLRPGACDWPGRHPGRDPVRRGNGAGGSCMATHQAGFLAS